MPKPGSTQVAETMNRRVTRLDHAQGLAANLITAVLVLLASRFGLPVSTTHVSVGSIASVGASAGSLDLRTPRNVLLSWVATLPIAAVLAWVAATAVADVVPPLRNELHRCRQEAFKLQGKCVPAAALAKPDPDTDRIRFKGEKNACKTV